MPSTRSPAKATKREPSPTFRESMTASPDTSRVPGESTDAPVAAAMSDTLIRIMLSHSDQDAGLTPRMLTACCAISLKATPADPDER